MRKIYLLAAILFTLLSTAQSLEKDAQFNLFSHPVGQYYVDGIGSHCLAQPDGKLLVVETSFVNPAVSKLTRVTSTNILDVGFDHANTFNGLIRDLALQPDGKIVIVGAFTTVNGLPYKYIVRLNANGTIDDSFNIGTGFSTYVNSNYKFASAVAIRPDGKILVGGDLMQYNGVYKNSLYLLNPDGSVDESLTLDPSIGQPSISKITLLAGGEILIATQFFSNIYKLLPNGTRHATHFQEMLTFGSNTSPASNTVIRAMVEQPDGKILIGGRFTTVEGLTRRDFIRVNIDGTLDNSVSATGFNGPSALLDDTRTGVSSILLQEDGKIILGGDFRKYFTTPAHGILRLNHDLSHDEQFVSGLDNDSSDYIHYYSYFNAMAWHPDGDLVGVGHFKNYNDTASNNIVKVGANGAKASDFSNICRGFDQSMQKFELQPDGKILAIGRFHAYNGFNRNRIIRLEPNGTVDEGFEVSTHNFMLDHESPRDIKIQPDGKILIASDGRYFGASRGGSLVRLNPDGSNDSDFNPLIEGNYGVRGQVRAIGLQDDGKIIIGGGFQFGSTATTHQMARFNADGTHDPTFTFTSPFTSVAKIHVNPDGTILALGIIDTYRHKIIRLLPTGALDPGFEMATSLYYMNNKNLYMDIQPDGKILVTSDSPGQSSHKISRMNPDGSLDTTFNFTPIPTYFYGNQCATEFMPDGKILIAVPNTVNPAGLLRINPNGSMDTTFNLGEGIGNGYGYSIAAVDKIAAIKIQPDGKILLGGGFRTFQGEPERGILRLSDPFLSHPEFSSAQRLAIYPNPATSHLNFDQNLDGQPYQVHNALGQTVQSGKILGNIPVSGLTTGIYILKIGTMQPVRFIKQ